MGTHARTSTLSSEAYASSRATPCTRPARGSGSSQRPTATVLIGHFRHCKDDPRATEEVFLWRVADVIPSRGATIFHHPFRGPSCPEAGITLSRYSTL
jgi:hypothetical protein